MRDIETSENDGSVALGGGQTADAGKTTVVDVHVFTGRGGVSPAHISVSQEETATDSDLIAALEGEMRQLRERVQRLEETALRNSQRVVR